MKAMAALAAVLCGTALNVSALGAEAEANQITQYGITWTFESPVRAGRFVNGDWWVCPDEPNGTVTVASVRPSPTGSDANARNGSMANPAPGSAQAYDGRAGGYKADLAVTFPYRMPVNTSLVSAVSRPENTDFSRPGNNLGGRSRGRISDAAILTCLAQSPPADAFRPAYSDPAKKLYRAKALDLSKLPSLASVADTPTLAAYERWFERVWLDHFVEYLSQTIHPNNNMPSYGRYITHRIGDGALMLCLRDVGDRKTLAVRMVQLGIDLYGVADNGGYWPGNGGHNAGRKLPILLAGLLLNEKEMLGIAKRRRTATSWRFQGDDQTFYVTEADVARPLNVMACKGLALSATANTIGVNRPSKYAPLADLYLEIVSGPARASGDTSRNQRSPGRAETAS